MLKNIGDWIKGKWWIKWVLFVVVAFIGYRVIVKKGAKLVNRLAQKSINWTPVPGSPNVILIRDPETKVSELVQLPPGIKSDDIQSAAKGKMDTYEVTINHVTVDRRSIAGTGNALNSLGY